MTAARDAPRVRDVLSGEPNGSGKSIGELSGRGAKGQRETSDVRNEPSGTMSATPRLMDRIWNGDQGGPRARINDECDPSPAPAAGDRRSGNVDRDENAAEQWDHRRRRTLLSKCADDNQRVGSDRHHAEQRQHHCGHPAQSEIVRRRDHDDHSRQRAPETPRQSIHHRQCATDFAIESQIETRASDYVRAAGVNPVAREHFGVSAHSVSTRGTRFPFVLSTCNRCGPLRDYTSNVWPKWGMTGSSSQRSRRSSARAWADSGSPWTRKARPMWLSAAMRPSHH